jgi:hypothetical protein
MKKVNKYFIWGIMVLIALALGIGIGYRIVPKSNSSNLLPALETSSDNKFSGSPEKIVYSSSSNQIFGEYETITVTSWKISNENTSPSILSINISFKNNTSKPIFMEDFAISKIRVWQITGQDVFQMALRLANLANLTIQPHQTYKMVINAESGLPFDSPHPSPYSFVLQVTEKDNGQEPLGGLILGLVQK